MNLQSLWQRIERLILPDRAVLPAIPPRGTTDEDIQAVERKFGIALPDDFKEFQRRLNQDRCWRLGRWIFYPLNKIDAPTMLKIRDPLYDGDYDESQRWNSKWLCFAREADGLNLMGLNLDPDVDVDSIESMFSEMNEVFEYLANEEEYELACEGVGFGEWLENLVAELEAK